VSKCIPSYWEGVITLLRGTSQGKKEGEEWRKNKEGFTYENL
jgi:hypothetical protein